MKKIFTTLYFLLFIIISSKAQQVYTFSYETVVEITSSEDHKTFKMSYLLNPKTKYIGLKVDMSEYSDEDNSGESIIVLDNGNSQIFVETQGMKMQMPQTMMGGNQMSNPSEELSKYDYSGLTKTNETKTILGALCNKYTMSDKDVSMELWVAPSIKLPNWFVQNSDVIDGHILEYTVTSSKGTMRSKTIEIKDQINTTLNPKDYKKMF